MEPKADDGEFSVVVTANTNLSVNSPEVEQLGVPPVGEVEENDTEPDLDAMTAPLAAEHVRETTRSFCCLDYHIRSRHIVAIGH